MSFFLFDFFDFFFDFFLIFLSTGKSNIPENPLTVYIDKIVMHYVKIAMSLLNRHLPSMDFVLPSFLDFFYNQLLVGFPLKPFNLKSMIFLKDALDESGKHSRAAELAHIRAIVLSFFDEPRIRQLVSVLVRRSFVLQMDDLNQWNEAPEDFIQENLTGTFQFNVLPCAEALFLVLLREFPIAVASCVLSLVNEILANVPAGLEGVLTKDACYNALGLCPEELSEQLPFPKFFTVIVNDLAAANELYSHARLFAF